MSESSIATVRRLFERFDPGKLESALELVSEDFFAEIPGSMSAEPDVYEGHDGARRYFAGFEGLIDDVRFEPIEFVEHDDAVIVQLRLTGRGAASGIEVEQHAAVVVWVEDGLVTRMQPEPDMDAAREALRG
jgi:ketosteroid isomerase-like protein